MTDEDEIRTYRVLQDGINVAGMAREIGDLVDLKKVEGDILAKNELVELTDHDSAAEEDDELPEERHAEKGGGSGEGVNVEGLLPGGAFLSADDVEEGDTATVKGAGEIDDSFEDERLLLPIEYMNEEKRVSLGSENIQRIADGYGMNTASWIGKEIEVVLIKEYKGLGEKGIVWKAAE